MGEIHPTQSDYFVTVECLPLSKIFDQTTFFNFPSIDIVLLLIRQIPRMPNLYEWKTMDA